MKTGKISESILKRSVLGRIKSYGEKTICRAEDSEHELSLCSLEKGAGIGEDCAFLAWENTFFADEGDRRKLLTAVSTQTISLPVKKSAYLAIMAAANNVAASGAVARAVTLSFTLPEETEEPALRAMMDQARECCQELNIQIAGGHTEVSAVVLSPIISATAIGPLIGKQSGHGGRVEMEGVMAVSATEKRFSKENGTRVSENLDIVVSKWIGIEGISIIVQEKEEELLRRFSARFLEVAKEQERYLSVAPEAAIALKSNVYAMHDVRNGGIFGALWELSQKLGVGLTTDLKKIPVKQETIEVCELFNLNPYELLSGGALLMATEDGFELVRRLEEAGIPAALIGRTNGSNDRIVINGEENRFLCSPGTDEIYKLKFMP